MVLKYNLESSDVVVVDTTPHELTSHHRLQALFDQGYRLEAAAAQALLVEAMTLHYLLARHKVDGVEYREDPRALHRAHRLTFGRTYRLLADADGFHSEELQVELERYVVLRNDLAHHLVGMARALDYRAFFQLGCSIIDHLRTHFHGIIQQHEGP